MIPECEVAIIDEAHHIFPREGSSATELLAPGTEALCLITLTAGDLALLFVLLSVPGAVLGPLLGVAIDRLGPRRTLLIANLTGAAGTGKTTCAFFRPGSDEVEFSSSHRNPEALAKQAPSWLGSVRCRASASSQQPPCMPS